MCLTAQVAPLKHLAFSGASTKLPGLWRCHGLHQCLGNVICMNKTAVDTHV